MGHIQRQCFEPSRKLLIRCVDKHIESYPSLTRPSIPDICRCRTEKSLDDLQRGISVPIYRLGNRINRRQASRPDLVPRLRCCLPIGFNPRIRFNRLVFLNRPVLSLETHLGVTTSPQAPLSADFVTLSVDRSASSPHSAATLNHAVRPRASAAPRACAHHECRDHRPTHRFNIIVTFRNPPVAAKFKCSDWRADRIVLAVVGQISFSRT